MQAILEDPLAPEAASAVIETTLYDLMNAMHDEIEPGEEDLVVTCVMHLWRSGRITFRKRSARQNGAMLS